MRKVLFGLITAVMLLGTVACTKNDEYPTITNEGIVAVPKDCDVFERGGQIPFRYRKLHHHLLIRLHKLYIQESYLLFLLFDLFLSMLFQLAFLYF